MDLFENMDKIKEDMTQTLDKIIDEKNRLYDQIKRLETENYIINNNIEFFETYLSFLEHKKSSGKSVSSIENNFGIGPKDLKFEEFVNLNNGNKNIKIDANSIKNHNDYNNNMDYEKNSNNHEIMREKHYFNNLYDI